MADLLEIPAPDLGAATLSATRRGGLPPGALGDTAAWVDAMAALRRAPDLPVAAASAHLVVFAGDHGLSDRRCTAELPVASAHRAAQLASGEHPISLLAAATGVAVQVVDLALDTDQTPPGVQDLRVRRASGPIDIQDALTITEVATAIQTGRDLADRLADQGADQLIGSVCGVGAGVAAAAIASVLTGVEPVDCTGRGTGVDDDAWIRRAEVVRDARYRMTAAGTDAASLLRVGGGADLAALTGFVLQSAIRGVPVLVDDLPGTVAAVLAHRFAPGAERYVLVPATLPDVAHRRLLGLLGISPLTTVALGSGPALPSLLLLPMLRLAAGLVDDAPAERPDRAPWSQPDWDRSLL